jgi:hypothetical protein
MKRIFMAAASLAVLGMAAPAMAEGNNLAQTINIDGTNPPQCNVSATTTSVTLTTNSISTTSGFINTGLSASVASLLNGAGIVAWCTGNTNGVVLSRTALVTGSGATNNGFAEGALYDLSAHIADATRSDGNTNELDGTSDGAGNGPGVGVGSGSHVSSFGPAGTGSPVTFTAEAAGVTAAVTNGTAGGAGADGDFSQTSNRLVAGHYTGTVTLTLTPGT